MGLSRTAQDGMAELQRCGVPAHAVQNKVECFNDPQLRHRGYFVEVPHGSVGRTWVENSRFHLSRTPALVLQAGPTLGEHTSEVLSTILATATIASPISLPPRCQVSAAVALLPQR